MELLNHGGTKIHIKHEIAPIHSKKEFNWIMKIEKNFQLKYKNCRSMEISASQQKTKSIATQLFNIE